MLKKRIVVILVILLILAIDQAIKFWVKTHMCLGESIELQNWAYIAFTENKGMAFGMDFIGTIALCCFRILAIGALVWGMIRITAQRTIQWGFVILMAMIIAGAIGNIIDNVFYGLIYTQSTPYDVAALVPMGEGYGNLFSGKVVDMFYFPMIQTSWPDWMPLCGGERFVFFSPIFNFADASISVGGFLIVVCYYKTLNRLLSRSKENEQEPSSQGDKEL